MAKLIAYAHHERWDGTGYPFGLAEDAIPLAARIVAVADVYDALTTKRPYKRAFPHSEAYRMIASGAGTQFDPEVVSAFVSMETEFKQIARDLADHPAGRDGRCIFGSRDRQRRHVGPVGWALLPVALACATRFFSVTYSLPRTFRFRSREATACASLGRQSEVDALPNASRKATTGAA